MTNLIIREDGSRIDKATIISCEHEGQVNTSTDFTFGCAVPDCITVVAKGDMEDAVASGEKLIYFQVDEDGTQKKIGTFYAEKPTIATKNSYSFVAYDTLSKLDKNLSPQLYEMNQMDGSFPISLKNIVNLVCEACEVTMLTTAFPNEDFMVKAFYADNLTGRDLIGMVAELAGKFVRCDADGNIYFDWFKANNTVEIAPGNGTKGGKTQIGYFSGQLSFQKYVTAQVDRVQIQQMDGDIGIIYPDDTTGVTYQVVGNILLTNATATDMRTVAANLYPIIRTIAYTPFSVKIPKCNLIRPGDIIQITDSNGVSFQSPVMKVTTDASGTTVESEGTESRESGEAVNSRRFENLTGRVLKVEQSYQGLRVQASDLQGKYSELNQTVEELEVIVKEEGKNTVVSLIVEFAQGDSSSTAPTTGWSTTAPQWDADKYIWQRTVTTYIDKTKVYSNPICVQGANGENGVGIASITEYYQVSESNTEAPTEWLTTVPSMTPENKYLWNYERITYTDKSTTDTDKRVIGAYGEDGTSIGTIINYYLATSADSGVTVETEGWTNEPQSMTPENKYLWNYEVVWLTDGTQANTSTPCIIGAYGEDGEDGVGITSIIPEYYLSTSASATTGGSWSTTPPEWVEGKYIWTRSHIYWDDGTDTTTAAQLDNSINDMGEKYSQIKQTADKISWLVADGTSQSNFTLTSRAMALATSEINLTTKDISIQTNVEAVSGAAYGFSKDSDGYFAPGNYHVANSRAWCRVYVTVQNEQTVELSCIQSSEANYDYGIISKVDTQLDATVTDTSKILHNFKGITATDPVKKNITIPAGTHFFDVQYIKDGTTDTGLDAFKFKLPENLVGSSLTIRSGQTVLNSTDILFKGMVTFGDLAGEGNTVINGSNIVTGTIRGVNVITEAFWINWDSYPHYRLAQLDAGGVKWYAEKRTTGGDVLETLRVGEIAVSRDFEGTASEQFNEEVWMCLFTENNNGILLDSGDHIIMRVPSGKTIGLGNTDAGQQIQIGMLTNYYTCTYTEIHGDLKIKPRGNNSFGEVGDCLYSGGADGSVWWGEAPWTQFVLLTTPSIASRGTVWHYAASSGYRAIVVLGHVSGTYTEMSCIIPIHAMDGTKKFQIADESYYMNFVVGQDSLTFSASNNSYAGIDAVFGIK